MSDGHGHLRVDFVKAFGEQSSFQVCFIDALVAKAAEFILAGVSVAHDAVVALLELVSPQAADRQYTVNGHWGRMAGECGQRNSDFQIR